MKRGFTLIELLGVIIILSLLVILVFPSIVNSIRNSSEKTDDLTLQLIYNAADLYIKDYKNNFPKINGGKYIVDLEDLVGEGLLISPIKLSESDEDLTSKKCVQVSYNNGFDYELKNDSECIIRLFDDVNVDIDGDGKLTEQDPILLSKYLFSVYAVEYALEFDETLIKGDTDINKDNIFKADDVNELSKALGYVRIIPGIVGDADGNGVIEFADSEAIQNYAGYIIAANADANGDGFHNIIDVSSINKTITPSNATS